MTIEIRPESPNLFREVEALVREAFWNVYAPGCTEHYLLHVMRRSPNFVCELSLVVLEDKAIVGQIAFTRDWIACDDGQNRQVLTLGPLSVHPAHQRKGIGKSLIERACAKACDMGFAAVLLCGDPLYYARAGFEPAQKYGVRTQDDQFMDALQIRALAIEMLSACAGRYFVDPIFDVDEAAAQRFDQVFEAKIKIQGTVSQKRFAELAAKRRPYL